MVFELGRTIDWRGYWSASGPDAYGAGSSTVGNKGSAQFRELAKDHPLLALSSLLCAGRPSECVGDPDSTPVYFSKVWNPGGGSFSPSTPHRCGTSSRARG